jgi:hypothetical protein
MTCYEVTFTLYLYEIKTKGSQEFCLSCTSKLSLSMCLWISSTFLATADKGIRKELTYFAPSTQLYKKKSILCNITRLSFFPHSTLNYKCESLLLYSKQ